MKRILALALLISMAFGAVAASAATEVKMTGDARVYGNYWSKYNYTGWNAAGSQTYDSLTIWERFRLRSDFIANEGLKFRLGIRVNDAPWGAGTFTVDNPAVSIQVYQAFMQFKWPNTQVEFTVGLQNVDLPMSADWLGSNPVFGGTRAAAALVAIPVVDQLKVVGGFIRFLDTNKDFDTTTKQVPDEFDGYLLTLPITLDGFSATPWGMIAVAGRNANYGTFVGNGGPNTNETLATYLFSAGTYAAPVGLKNSQNVFWWVGSSFAVTALDPFKFYADIVYGEGNGNDRGKSKRAGLFFDVAAEYTGFDAVTPQLTFWYSTGEDGSTRNGSERLPAVVNYWGPSNSFMFGNQDFNFGGMPTSSIGSWGLVFALDKISFMQDLTHRLAFTYARGTNSARALRTANLLTGTGPNQYVMMGRDLTTNEYVMGINFDNQYNIYQNLALIVETGWAHGSFEKSVWGRRFVNRANDGDTWKVAFGLQYKF
ncbi:outer membrane homotrimeric porin [Fundidesulfovibrio terrae]|uniref:outer membrane homotrimeric porin n=1 Tax=Fundidesulfovibrio terrae TaxID=2922866 RepID=UPI001FAFFA51|nr:outer membrane homotrimeric porin [Fundidesulfovibrio terrae]